MTHRHTLLVVSVALAMLVSPTILAQETATATRNTTNESGETAGMGAQLTAFTQSSSTAVNESVENGMWKAGFNRSNASDRPRLVTERSGALERRLDRLQRQNESVQERYENGSLPQPAYIAQQSRLSARIDALRTAVNDTGEAAARAGVNDSRLAGLQQNAANLTGPEVATIARGLGGGPPEARGPPEDRGPPEARGPPEDRVEARGSPEDRAEARGSPEARGDRRPSVDASDREQSGNRIRGADGGDERGQSGNRIQGADGGDERGQSVNRPRGGDAAADNDGNDIGGNQSEQVTNETGDTAGSQGAADGTAGSQENTSDRGRGTDRGPPDDAPGQPRN